MADYRDHYKGKKVLVTGGLGFLGSNLVLELVALGAKVQIVDSLDENHGGNHFNVAPVKDEVEVLIADIRDRTEMDEVVSGKDLIFNIASQTSHVDSNRDPFLDADVNINGHLTVLEACRAKNPQVKIVYCGTRAQYGRPETTPVDERAPMHPLDIYGINKHAAEQYHFLYQTLCGLRATSLRVNNTYGPRHQMKHAKFGVQNYFLRQALDGQNISLYAPGTQQRDFNYVDDVTDAFLRAGAMDEANGEVFNLGSGAPITLLDYVKLIIDLTGSGSYTLEPWPAERKMIETGDYIADYRKATEVLGWEPKTNLKDGLQETINFYRQHKREYWQ